MKNRIIAFLLAFTLIASVMSGCSFVLERDYLVITPYLQQHSEATAEENARAETFDELKSGILRLVSEGTEEGVIRLYNYSGNVEQDVQEACLQTTRNEPLGVFAVDAIVYTSHSILTYYEVTVSITYRRTPEQIKSVVIVNNAQEFRSALDDVYSKYGNSLIAETDFYITTQYDIAHMLEEKYDSDPLHIFAMPSYTFNRYPETGWRRILEVEIKYDLTPDQLKAKADTLLSAASDLLAQETPAAGNDEIVALHKSLIEHVDYLPDSKNDLDWASKDDTFTAYGAIVNANATSEGYALAYKALCDMSGVECKVIRGRYDGAQHCWNMVKTDLGWYHVDTALDDATVSNDFLLKNDTQMKVTHKWTLSSYPSGNNPEIVLDAVETVRAINGFLPDKVNN